MKRRNLLSYKAIALSLVLAGSMMTGCGNTDKQAKNDTAVTEEVKDTDTEDTNAEGSDTISEEENVEDFKDSEESKDKDAADKDSKDKAESTNKEE